MVANAPAVRKEPFSSSAFWVGIGCKRSTPKRLIEQAIRTVFRERGLHEGSIAGVATIDTKANEAGLIAFCCDHNLPLRFYAAERLRSVVVPNPSSAIDTVMGTPSVAEAAALLACWEAGRRRECQIIAETQRRGESMPMLFSTLILCVPKQCYRSGESMGAITIAVATYPESP